MKAITHDRYGSPDVLQLQDVDKPVVNDDEVLVRVRAASLNPYDWHFMTGLPYFMRMLCGLRKPKVNSLGADLAGEVEAVGKSVTKLRPGDEVFGVVATGAFAECVCAKERTVALKPVNLTFEQAAAVPIGALTALQTLRDHGRVEPGQTVLINGASGGVGTFAVQIAKSFGAEVTGVCSTRNGDLVRSLGADHVIDYTQEDFTQGGQRYDLMLDLIGNHSLSACRRVLNPKGIYVASFGHPENLWLGPMVRMLMMVASSRFVSQELRTFIAKTNSADLLVLKELIEAGTITPVIDRQYALSEVPEAFRYLQEWHVRGKVVISV